MNSQPHHTSIHRGILIAIAAVVVGLQVAATGPLRGIMWGSHLYAFTPTVAGPIAWLMVAALGFVLLRRKDGATLSTWGTSRFVIVAAVAAVLAGFIYWSFRSHTDLLGDAVPLMIDLPGGKAFHPRQPLAMWLQQQCYQWLTDIAPTAPMVDQQAAARRAVAIGSTISGVAFVFVAAGIARILMRSDSDRLATALAAIVILAQGYTVLFFGYIENYSYQLLTVGIYLLAVLAWLAGRLPLAAAAGALVLALGVHLSSVALLPSFAYALAVGLRDPARRRGALVAAATLIAASLVLHALLGRMSPGYSLWSGVADITGIARTSQGGGAGLSYLVSPGHLRDFVSAQLLIGPLGAVWFVAAAVAGARDRTLLRQQPAVFLAVASIVFLVASAGMSEPLLGYARDWDLLAATGLAYTTAALAIVAVQVDRQRLRNLLAFAAVLSLTHLIPFAWINHSTERSIRRFSTLPLGHGKTETTIANHYFRHAQNDSAEVWFRRALDVDPANPNANSLLGRLLAGEGRYREGAEFLRRALVVRPDKVSIRRTYALTLVFDGRCDEALGHLKQLLGEIPSDLDFWHSVGDRMRAAGCIDQLSQVYQPLLAAMDVRLRSEPVDPVLMQHSAIMLSRLGRIDEAVSRFGRALEIAPSDPNALFNLAWTLHDAGREDAPRWLREFLRRHPESPLAPRVQQALAGYSE